MPLITKKIYCHLLVLALLFFAGWTTSIFAQQATLAQDFEGRAVTYPEMQAYHATLSAVNVRAYEYALAQYNSQTLPEPVLKSDRNLARRYEDVSARPAKDADQIADKIIAYESLSYAAAQKREKRLELDCLYRAFELAFWSEHRQYARAFEIALLMEQRLATVSTKEYPQRGTAYFRLSEAYYLFNDFDKSIDLGLKAIAVKTDPAFTDRSALEARRVVAICYANQGEMDLSDAYFMSIIESKDMVLGRPVLNAMALANLGCNAMMRGQYHKAIALDLEVIDLLKQADDPGHIAGMYACQCASYFALGQPDKVGFIVDSILHYAHMDTYHPNKRLKQAYSNLSKYSGITRNYPKMQQWQDSLVAVYKREEAATASQFILQAQQELTKKETAVREEEMRRQGTFIYTVLGVLLLTLAFAMVLLRLYRRKQAAYRVLAAKASRWAHGGEEFPTPTLPNKTSAENRSEPLTEEEDKIMSLIQTEMTKKLAYREAGLTAESLAKRLGVHRNTISKAINKSTGGNFNYYINGFRIREAVRLLSESSAEKLYIDELSERVGFTNHSSFYRAFKQFIGLSPAEFRKNKGNNFKN